MEITVANFEDAPFCSLAFGDVFKCGNYFYMKLVEQCATTTDYDGVKCEVNAIGLDTAVLVYISASERVTPYSAKLILTPKTLDKISNI